MLIILAILFQLAHTAYFGWNFYPSCPAERHCDSLATIMMIIGMFVWGYRKGKEAK